MAYTLIATIAKGVEAYTDNVVDNGKTYYYYVTSVDATGNESNPSAADSAVPNPIAYYTVSNLTATGGTGSVLLEWTDPTGGGWSQLRVKRSLDGIAYQIVYSALPGEEMYTDSSLNSGTLYYYVVTTITSQGKELSTSITVSATPS